MSLGIVRDVLKKQSSEESSLTSESEIFNLVKTLDESEVRKQGMILATLARGDFFKERHLQFKFPSKIL